MGDDSHLDSNQIVNETQVGESDDLQFSPSIANAYATTAVATHRLLLQAPFRFKSPVSRPSFFSTPFSDGGAVQFHNHVLTYSQQLLGGEEDYSRHM